MHDEPLDEPLAEWARRRDDRRAAERQITGTRRAVPLRSEPCASHIDPDGPSALRVTYLPGTGRRLGRSAPRVRSPAEVVIVSRDLQRGSTPRHGLTLLVSVTTPAGCLHHTRL